jgi:anti-sigma B factor antagonist
MTGSTGSPATSHRPAANLTVTRRAGSVRVCAQGELAAEAARQLGAVLREVEPTARRVTVDLHELTLMDSSAVELLMEHVARAEHDGFALSIVLPGPSVARVLDIAGVRDLLPIAAEPPGVASPEPAVRWPGPAPVAAGHLHVWIDDAPARALIRLVGELDLGTAPRLRQAIDAHARDGRTIVVDLREVGFIDSMGLAALVGARRRAHARGARLQLVAAAAPVHVVFVLSGLHAIFDWVPGAAQPT